jgi:hypothetical protein
MADVINNTIGLMESGFDQNCFGFIVEGFLMVSKALGNFSWLMLGSSQIYSTVLHNMNDFHDLDDLHEL